MPAIIPAPSVEESPSTNSLKPAVVPVEQSTEEVPIEEESPETKAQNLAASLLKALTESTTFEERSSAALEISSFLKENGLSSYGVFDAIKAAAVNKKSTTAREGAQLAFAALSEAFGQTSEPYLVPNLSLILEAYSDKQASVRSAAEKAGKAILAQSSAFAIPILLPILFDAISNAKWQSKVASLNLITSMAQTSPEQIKARLVDIIPCVSAAMWDTKADVTKAATTTMTEVCAVAGNPDIVPCIPQIIGCIANPSKVADTIYALSATTFVTQVEAPALAIMTPLLERGLAERTPVTQRQTSVIINNMCKLVEDPTAVIQFLPKLLPGLERIIEIAANPELRSVATNARVTLLRVGGNGNTVEAPATLNETPKTVEARLQVEIKEVASTSVNVDASTLSYISTLVAQLISTRVFETESWEACIIPYLSVFLGQEASKAAADRLQAYYSEMDKKLRKEASAEADADEGEKICDCEFSLAYGGMILLNNTRLVLRRGQRYGILGPNGSGKTTLMRAIAEGKLDGFPPADELRTVFVEHNLQGSEAELSVVDFIASDPQLVGTPRDEIVRMLTSIGFSDEIQDKAVGTLSGGNKMRCELARAMLMNADILLLDEPTNHMDVQNVAWLESYLMSLPNVTSMIVSHDSGFLDRVCTGVIHYESLKLKAYKGNLAAFVAQHPEARSYYELSSVTQKFGLPEPGFLDGVKSKDKAILKMQSVSFAYPGSSKPTVSNISVQVSLSSRIGVVGPNGAGKSTIIKLLTGELVTNDGVITKHPNLRVAYIAQHAFHHLDHHLDKTPNEYIRWRYQYGEDRELLASQSRQISPEETTIMQKVITFEGSKRQIDILVGRRKSKRSFEYEVQWVGKSYEENSWVSREQLEEWGFSKVLQAFDDKEAAKAGAWSRPLTSVEVEKHLGQLGLEPEFATHSRIRGLSGGQKLKACLASSTWLHPHVIVLDEPTNFIDRDSLGALTEALKEFGGGIVVISHNAEFVSALCVEKWKVEAGLAEVTGNTYTQKAEKIEIKEAETKIDAFGNVEKVKSTKKLTRKEKMQRDKKRAAAKKNGEVLSDDDEDF